MTPDPPPSPPHCPSPATPRRPADGAAEAPRSFSASGTNVEKSLTGRLPCVGCGYNLQGLSVVGVCPECGAAVRATILAIIDPLAEELRPVVHPRLAALGIVTWAASALGAALIVGYALAATVLPVIVMGIGRPRFPAWAPFVVQILVVVSALGALGFVRPHRGVGLRIILAGLVAVAAYAPLTWLVGTLLTATAQSAITAGNVDPWQIGGTATGQHYTLLRIALHGLLLAIIGGLRPGARLLVGRSLALRTGRVDRQTMMAMAAAVFLSIFGDLLGFMGSGSPGTASDALKTAGIVLMIVGASLLTLGLAGSVVDCIRIARAIVAPAPSLRQVIDEDDAEPATIGGGQ